MPPQSQPYTEEVFPHAHVVWYEEGASHRNIETYPHAEHGRQRWMALRSTTPDSPDAVITEPLDVCRKRWCAQLPDYLAVGMRERAVLKS